MLFKEHNAQVWLNNVKKAIAANDARAMQAIPYFFQNTTNLCNNNSINKLANTFTTIKQGENKAVTTYLGCFHRNLYQIQAINPNYFTFICGLCSSIQQCVRPMHPINLDFKAVELKANYVQAINLVMNGSSELDSKLKQFSDSINQKLEGYLADNHAIYQPPQQRNNSGNMNCFQNQSCPSLAISSELLIYDTAAILSTPSISNANLLIDNTSNLLAAATTHLLAAVPDNISAPTNSNTTTKLTSKWNPKAKIDPTKLEIINDSPLTNFHLLVTPEDTQPNNPETNQHPTLTSNILPATITENESLDAIFPFELEESLTMPLFSGVLWKKNLLLPYYQVNRAANARIITANGATKTPIGEIDNFPFEVNGIIIPIKVLVIEAIQYQALVGNDWLSKTNAILDWMTQELQLSQNGQHTHVPAMCGHFKTINSTTPLIKLEEEKKKPT
ncbi:hypothetical protein G9A89_013849 [Geosiphon pyriformis]|nr:hypothetical protein G9A89_013849 [Geosiphon pyriformis]